MPGIIAPTADPGENLPGTGVAPGVLPILGLAVLLLAAGTAVIIHGRTRRAR